MNKILIGVIALFYFFTGEQYCQPENAESNFNYSAANGLCYSKLLRDTLYTNGNYFLELNLKTQKGYLHYRFGATKEFGISTGTDKFEDGVKTKTGLFVIQAKLPQWYSVQFDSTLMLNWMGFNFGIGLHALKTNGYYRHLGKRKSSHGCVRVSRYIAKELYSKIMVGTPVLVHDGTNAVTVAFNYSCDEYEPRSYSETYKLTMKSLRNLYSGFYFMSPKPHIIIDKNNVHHNGLPVGYWRKILRRQIIPPIYKWIEDSALAAGPEIQPISRSTNFSNCIVLFDEYRN